MNPSYSVDGDPGGGFESETPTRESRNVVAVLAAYEVALNRQRSAPTREVAVAAEEVPDELAAAGPLTEDDVPGSSDELNDAPSTGTQTQAALDALGLATPWWRRPATLVGALVAAGAAALAYRLFIATG